MGQYPEHLLEVIAAEHDNADIYDHYDMEGYDMSTEEVIKYEFDAIVRYINDNMTDKNKYNVMEFVKNSKGRTLAILEKNKTNKA
jgi:hypothetical protein